MAPQNHPLKLVYLVFPIFIRTLNGVDQMITEPGVSGRVPFCSSGFQKARGGLYGLSKDPGGLQKQHQHHHRGNIADHHPVELLAAEGLAVALHLVNDVIRRHDPANQDGGQQGNEGHHDAVADIVHDIQQLPHRSVGEQSSGQDDRTCHRRFYS